MTYKHILLAAVASALLSTTVFAQTSSTTTSTVDSELCTMSNGSTIPCAFLGDAEKDITSNGKVTDRVSGTEFCQTDDGYAPCQELTEDGNIGFVYQLQQYSNKVLIFIFQYGLYFAGALALLLGAKFLRKRMK